MRMNSPICIQGLDQEGVIKNVISWGSVKPTSNHNNELFQYWSAFSKFPEKLIPVILNAVWKTAPFIYAITGGGQEDGGGGTEGLSLSCSRGLTATIS